MPSWASATAVMASIKYNNPTSGVDWFYITICQQWVRCIQPTNRSRGTGSSFVTRYIPNQNSVTVIQTITTASECSDVDTFTIDNTNYMIVGSSLSSTQALYRWNQAVEEWDLLTTVSVQTGTSSHLVYKDSNNVVSNSPNVWAKHYRHGLSSAIIFFHLSPDTHCTSLFNVNKFLANFSQTAQTRTFISVLSLRWAFTTLLWH